MKIRTFSALAIFFAVGALSACGGGGSYNAPPLAEPTEPVGTPAVSFAAAGQVGADNPRVGLLAFSDNSGEGAGTPSSFRITLTADTPPTAALMVTLTMLAGVSAAQRDRFTAANGGVSWELATPPGESSADYSLHYAAGGEITCANRRCVAAWNAGAAELVLEIRIVDDSSFEVAEFLALGILGGDGDYETAFNPGAFAGEFTGGGGEVARASGVTPPTADENVAVADIEGDYRWLRRGADLRAGEELAHVSILGDEYVAANGLPGVQIQRLRHAHLGLWLVDFTFDDDKDGSNWHSRGSAGDADDDGLEIVYHLLDDNRVSTLPSSGTATYDLEGDIVYKGERFYPDSTLGFTSGLTADFGAATISGRIVAQPGDGPSVANYIGGPPCSMIGTIGDCLLSSGASALQDALILDFSGGTIANDGTFSGALSADSFLTSGYFNDLNGQTGGTFSGAFFDADTYDHLTDGNPAEIGGVFSITDTNGEILQGGFLGADEASAAPPGPAAFAGAVSGSGASGQAALTWTASAGASGYLIYRDGVLIETIGDGATTSYADTPGAGAHQYQIAATFDAADDSPRTTTSATIPKASGVSAPGADGAVSIADIQADYAAPARADVAPNGDDNSLRLGEEDLVPIVVDEYTDANDVAAVWVQHLSYAHLGIWLQDNTLDDDGDGTDLNNDDDGHDYPYRLLNDNRVANLPTSGTASYNMEADAIYKGERIYPDGGVNPETGNLISGSSSLTADFGAGTIAGVLLFERNGLNHPGRDALNDGTAFSSEGRYAFNIHLEDGEIAGDGTFSGDVRMEYNLFLGAGSFLADLDDRNSADAGTDGGFNGAFFDANDYNPTDDGNPAEVGGTFSITDPSGEKLQGGFLGVEE